MASDNTETTEQTLAALAFGRRGESLDVMDVASLLAAMESAQYWADRMITAKSFKTDLELLAAAARLAPKDGLALEFGVATGRTLNLLAHARSPSVVHGFDCFTGLPETWRTDYEHGAFAQESLPEVPENARLHVGLFAETLPDFMEQHHGPVNFLHVDCDLYSSTKDVLNHVGPRLNKNAVIVFHEYFNYPGWQRHEYKAFQEFLAESGRAYAYVGFVPSHQQVAVLLD